jgi:hypothetical protein
MASRLDAELSHARAILKIGSIPELWPDSQSADLELARATNRLAAPQRSKPFASCAHFGRTLSGEIELCSLSTKRSNLIPAHVSDCEVVAKSQTTFRYRRVEARRSSVACAIRTIHCKAKA